MREKKLWRGRVKKKKKATGNQNQTMNSCETVGISATQGVATLRASPQSCICAVVFVFSLL